MEYTYQITGVHCHSCLEKIKTALQPHVDSMELTLNPPTIKLNTIQPIPLDKLNTLVASAGDYKLIESKPGWLSTYYPLLLIITYITLISLVNNTSFTAINWHGWMTHFMAGFFLVFSAFKFLDLAGFATAYATYDLLAKRWFNYGLVYPFLELGLGLAYLTQVAPLLVYLATIIIMGFSSIGVIIALRRKHQFQCACLGTVLKMPMSMITLVEDLAMVIMALVMLIQF